MTKIEAEITLEAKTKDVLANSGTEEKPLVDVVQEPTHPWSFLTGTLYTGEIPLDSLGWTK